MKKINFPFLVAKPIDWATVRSVLADIPSALFGGLILGALMATVLGIALSPEHSWILASLWLGGTVLVWIPRAAIGREEWKRILRFGARDDDEPKEKK